MAEFSDMENYINYCRLNGGGAMGLAKINPPMEWNARKVGYESIDFQLVNRLHQKFMPTESYGRVVEICFTVSNKSEKGKWKLSQFKEKANKLNKLGTRDDPTCDVNIDIMYWSDFGFEAFYGSDQNGSLFDQDQIILNLNKVENLFDKVEPKIEIGVCSKKLAIM